MIREKIRSEAFAAGKAEAEKEIARLKAILGDLNDQNITLRAKVKSFEDRLVQQSDGITLKVGDLLDLIAGLRRMERGDE